MSGLSWKPQNWRTDLKKFFYVNLPNYLGAEQDGEAELYSYLTTTYQHCLPTGHEPMVVLAGYSQGAMLVHNVINLLVSDGQTGTAAMIKGSALIADPERVSFSNIVNFGTASAGDEGICPEAERLARDFHKSFSCTLFGPTADVANYFAGSTVAVCDNEDTVCDTSADLKSWNLGIVPDIKRDIADLKHGVWVHSNCDSYCGSEVRTAGRWIGRHLVADGLGATWSMQAVPSPPGGGIVDGVSCTSASACIAVGFSGTEQGTLAERWNGTSWTIQSTPNPSGALKVDLSGVSCTSASACIAVGFEQTSSNEFTVAERWNGTSWTIQSTPNPPGALNVELEGVSCTSASACTAVGSSDTNKLAEQWNGTSWTIQSTPNPSGSTDGALEGVSCTSASACTAVGWYETSAGVFALAERWNGTSWTIQSTPNPNPELGPTLTGVSCTSANACTAVGYYETSSGATSPALAEQWNGTSWTIQSTPNPPGALYVDLSTVSCTSASACTAVGSYGTSSNQFTLAEQWNGTSWAVQTTPNPVGSQESELDGVFCISASACKAVGFYTNTNHEVPLAEEESG
jgi:hypothetical protein